MSEARSEYGAADALGALSRVPDSVNRAMRGGREAEAIATLEALVEAEPERAEVWFVLGNALFTTGAVDAARGAYARAASLDDRYAIGTMLRAGDTSRPLDAAPWMARLSPMEMRFPPEGGRPLVFLACDPVYFARMGRALALSVDRNAPGWDLHLHLANPDGETLGLVESLLERLGSARLSLSWEHTTQARDGSMGARTWLASMRYLRLPDLMDSLAAPTPIVVLDADSLLRRPPPPMDRWTPEAPGSLPWDISICDQNWFPMGPLWRFHGACVGVAPTPAARAFAGCAQALLARQALTPGGMIWMVDQFALSIAHRACLTQDPAFRMGSWAPEDVLPDRTGAGLALWSMGADRKTGDQVYRQAMEEILAE